MSKLHPHLKKYIKDVIISETKPNCKPSRWKEEAIKTIEEQIIDDLPNITTSEQFEHLIEVKISDIRQQLLIDIKSIENTVKQIPLDLIRRYNH